MKFNYYTNLTDTNPTKSFTIEEVVYTIQSNEYKEKIESLRKYNKSDITYSTLKKSLPVFTFNATFSNSKSASDFEALTGHLFFDIDEKDIPQDLSLEDTITYLKTLPYVSAIWRSCGGKGIGFLVKAAQVNQDNFSAYWIYIGNTLNLPIDKSCKNLNRLTFLSYDKDAYLNTNSTSFPFKETIKLKDLKAKRSHLLTTIYPTTLEVNDTFCTNLPICYTTQFVIPDEKAVLDFIIMPEGKVICNIWHGKANSVTEGNRNTMLCSNVAKYLYNFPNVDFDILYKRISANNKIYCSPPQPEASVYSLVKGMYEKHKQHTLSYPEQKKYIQLNYFNLRTTAEKQRVLGIARGMLRTYRTTKDFVYAYMKLKEEGNKTTHKALADLTGKSVSTSKRYRDTVEEIIQHLEETGELRISNSEHFYTGHLEKFNFHMNEKELTLEQQTLEEQ